MRRSLLLLDSPNQTKSVHEYYGPGTQPDYLSLIELARTFGRLVRAEALVNDGLPKGFARQFERAGYQVVYSHARDCDDRMIARAVAAHSDAETIVIGTGDHIIVPVVSLLKATGHSVVVAAVPFCVSDDLIQVADAFVECPVRYSHPRSAILERSSRLASSAAA